MLQTIFPGTGLTSSMLGFGCMRLPTKDGHVDEAEAIRMIRHAIDGGVRYIDTAYPYHGGESETVVGKALQDGYREKVILATKLPCWAVKTHEDMMRILDEQLAKLQTDHVDFYLMHAMNASRLKEMQELDYKRFLDEAQAQGKIRFPAFSFHDDYEAFMRVLNDYDWKMCQVQMNILDDANQATLEGIRQAGERGVGVVIMEPLRGGLLANPPEDVVGSAYLHPYPDLFVPAFGEGAPCILPRAHAAGPGWAAAEQAGWGSGFWGTAEKIYPGGDRWSAGISLRSDSPVGEGFCTGTGAGLFLGQNSPWGYYPGHRKNIKSGLHLRKLVNTGFRRCILW